MGQLRGFALLTPERRREIASKGGLAAHKKGTANRWNKKTAAAAGKKGGKVVSRDRDHMRRIGRKGGLRKHSLKKQATPLVKAKKFSDELADFIKFGE